ncbi:uncharacterized protein [Asterias amurensis]|uniref:uncharacterized protein n=1 Tax=Asterias amurensis TaxID=7602 RepID=UPI003AB1A523
MKADNMAEMNMCATPTSIEQSLGDRNVASDVEHQTPDDSAVTQSVSQGENQPSAPQCAPGDRCDATGKDGVGVAVDETCLSLTAVDEAYRAATSDCRQDYENLLLKMEIPNLAESDDVTLSDDDAEFTEADASTNSIVSGHDVTPGEREPDCGDDSTERGSVEPGDVPLRYYDNYSRRH